MKTKGKNLDVTRKMTVGEAYLKGDDEVRKVIWEYLNNNPNKRKAEFITPESLAKELR